MADRWETALGSAATAALAVVAGAVGAVVAGRRVAAGAVGVTTVRQITVVGTGETRAAPDRATVQLGVQSEGQTARDALTENTRRMNALLQELKEAGIQPSDIQTSNFRISPTYESNGRTVMGYQVHNTVAVVINDVTRAGELLDKVVSAGANTVYDMSFGIRNGRVLEETARTAAILDARARAMTMAHAAGTTVGKVISIRETISGPVPMMRMARAEMAMAAPAPIEAGEQTITAQVEITFELH